MLSNDVLDHNLLKSVALSALQSISCGLFTHSLVCNKSHALSGPFKYKFTNQKNVTVAMGKIQIKFF